MEEENFKLSTNSRSKSALSGPPLSNKNESKEAKTASNKFLVQTNDTRREVKKVIIVPSLPFSAMTIKNSDKEEKVLQNTLRNSSINCGSTKAFSTLVNNSRNLRANEILQYRTENFKKTSQFPTFISKSPNRPESKLDDLVRNLKTEIQNLDDLLKNYNNNMETIKSEIGFLDGDIC
jgi:hypothetical protein